MYDDDYSHLKHVGRSDGGDMYNGYDAEMKRNLMRKALDVKKDDAWYRKAIFTLSIVQLVLGIIYTVLLLSSFDRVAATSVIPWEALLFVNIAVSMAMYRDTHMPTTILFGTTSLLLFLVTVPAFVVQIIEIAKCTGDEDASEGECYDEVAVLRSAGITDADNVCTIDTLTAKGCTVECTAICPSTAGLGGQMTFIGLILVVSGVQMMMGIRQYRNYKETTKSYHHIERVERRRPGSAWHQDLLHHRNIGAYDDEYDENSADGGGGDGGYAYENTDPRASRIGDDDYFESSAARGDGGNRKRRAQLKVSSSTSSRFSEAAGVRRGAPADATSVNIGNVSSFEQQMRDQYPGTHND
jgi:hypothetical protein